MHLPNIVKQIGKTDGEEKVYVEDYVYTYLNELKKEKEIFPVRVALFGNIYRKGKKKFYLVYGASCVIDELECGRDEEQVRKEYFQEHELIGYVNIYGKNHELPGNKEGYYVFYEKNEAMQNYLLLCYQRKEKGRSVRETVRQDASGDMHLLMPKRWTVLVGDTIRKIFYGGCIIILAAAVTAVNDYGKINGFVEAADRVMAMAETDD